MKKEVEKRESSRGKVFSLICFILIIILGIVSFVGGIMGLFYGLYVQGILYFIAALFAFLPKKITKVPNWVKLLIIIAVFGIVFFMGRIPALMAETNFLYHNTGESFMLDGGDFFFFFYNLTKVTSVLVEGETKTTDGYFVFVNCGITNLKEDSLKMYPEFVLMDSQNNTYEGLGFGEYNEYFQHDLKKETYFLFEVPKTSQGFTFILRDDIGIHFVDLGV